MKVVQINAVYRTGSTGRTTWELHNALRRAKYDSYVFAAEGDSSEEGVYIIGNTLDRKFHAVQSRLTGKSGYGSVQTTKRLVRVLEKIEPDVLHLRNLHGNYINLPILFEYIHRKQPHLVVTLHDCWFYTGKCSHYTVDGCERWKHECGRCPRLRKDIPSWFFDRTKELLNDKKSFFSGIRNLDVVGVSNWITNEAQQSFLFGLAKFETIYNWINLDVYHPIDEDIIASFKEKNALVDKKIVLGVASGWCEAKGLSYFENLAERLPDDYAIILVGDFIEKPRMYNNLMLYGSTESSEELAMLYNVADVLFNASEEESFGKVSAESLACGTPIICFPTTANPELASDGCGQIIPVNNREALQQAVIMVAGAKEEYKQRCVEKAKYDFNMKKNIAAYMALYNDKV